MDKLKQVVKDNPELREFFEEIHQWMCDNDYECGPHGSEISIRISEILGESD